jgi:hypothetical protein
MRKEKAKEGSSYKDRSTKREQKEEITGTERQLRLLFIKMLGEKRQIEEKGEEKQRKRIWHVRRARHGRDMPSLHKMRTYRLPKT